MRKWIDLAVTLTESEGPPNSDVLLHGTKGVFEKFDSSRIRDGMQGRAIYLTNSPWYAGKFGPKLLEIRIKRPLNTITESDIEARGVKVYGRGLQKWAEENGFDGVWRCVGTHGMDKVWELACYDATALEVVGERLAEAKKHRRRKRRKTTFLGAGPVYNVMSDGCGDDSGGGGDAA